MLAAQAESATVWTLDLGCTCSRCKEGANDQLRATVGFVDGLQPRTRVRVDSTPGDDHHDVSKCLNRCKNESCSWCRYDLVLLAISNLMPEMVRLNRCQPYFFCRAGGVKCGMRNHRNSLFRRRCRTLLPRCHRGARQKELCRRMRSYSAANEQQGSRERKTVWCFQASCCRSGRRRGETWVLLLVQLLPVRASRGALRDVSPSHPVKQEPCEAGCRRWGWRDVWSCNYCCFPESMTLS